MKERNSTLAAWSVALVVAGTVAGPVAAQSDRQKDKNTTRNVGIGLGAAALHQALTGKGTRALILGAGAAYAGKKYEDARKAQSRESAQNEAASTEPIDVVLNERAVNFPDVEPVIVNDRVYVPLRGVLEKMGADVRWNPGNRTVIATQRNREVRLPVGGPATVNGRRVALDAPAMLIGGRTMVPLRFMAEAFGADVSWNGGERQVSINS
jgi:hypothetical protein